jgi:hypothetical protein
LLSKKPAVALSRVRSQRGRLGRRDDRQVNILREVMSDCEAGLNAIVAYLRTGPPRQ